MTDSLILLCNGSNGSSIFTDSSPSPKTVTAHGNAQISTAQSKSGGSSAYFDGSGDFLTVPADADLQFGSGDFTVESWIFPTTASGTRCIAAGQGDLATASGSSWVFYISATATSDVYIGSQNKSVASPNPQANQWSHVAFVRYGTALTSYLNGAQVATTTLTAGSAVNNGATNHTFAIGAFDNEGSPYTGYLGGLRIIKGLASYTSGFTPPDSFGSIAFLSYPSAGQLTVSGQVPSLKLGQVLTPTEGGVSVIGQVAKHSSDVFLAKPQEGSISVIGQVPALKLGRVLTPTEGSVSIIGQVPALKLGQVLTPTEGSVSVIGQIAKHSNDVVFARPQEGGISVIGQAPVLKLGQVLTPTQGTISVVGQVSIFADRVLKPIPPIWLATRYRCYLTGAAGLPDLELPISSFQTRINGDSVSYLSCILKGADSYTDAIALRSAGQLRVFRAYVLSDGTESTYLMSNVLFEQIDLNSGGRSGVTAQLSGTGNMVPVTAKSMTLQNPSYFGLSGGKHRYRCELDPRLRPGDTVTVNNDTFVVGGITHIVDTNFEMMEIAEA